MRRVAVAVLAVLAVGAPAQASAAGPLLRDTFEGKLKTRGYGEESRFIFGSCKGCPGRVAAHVLGRPKAKVLRMKRRGRWLSARIGKRTKCYGTLNRGRFFRKSYSVKFKIVRSVKVEGRRVATTLRVIERHTTKPCSGRRSTLVLKGKVKRRDKPQVGPADIDDSSPDECGRPLLRAFSADGSDIEGWDFAVSHRWNFGDGTRSTEAEPQHTYARPGTYPVSVFIRGWDGSVAKATKPLEVGPACG